MGQLKKKIVEFSFRLREEAEAALAASKAELERQMCHQRDQLMQEVHEAQNQLVRACCLVKKLSYYRRVKHDSACRYLNFKRTYHTQYIGN